LGEENKISRTTWPAFLEILLSRVAKRAAIRRRIGPPTRIADWRPGDISTLAGG
jgi:hypothetical protein